MTINQLSVFIENKPGSLYEITNMLSEAGIDVRAMSIADTKDFGIMRLLVNDVKKAKKELADNGYIVSETPVFVAVIFDRPGGLKDIVKLLGDNDINIEYMYAFVTISKQNAYAVLRVEDDEKAEKILTENNVRMVTQEDIAKL